MTPQEKAKELVHKMFNVDLYCDNEAMCMLYPHAIKCALIAVEEMILTLPSTASNKSLNEYAVWMQKYLEQVKQEIEKL